MRKYTLLFLVAALIVACTPRRQAVETVVETKEIILKKPAPFEFYILQLNDVYEISPLGDGRGGLARVASLRKQLMAFNPNVVTILSGDYISPSLIGSLKCEVTGGGKESMAGRHMVAVMNAMGVDYVTFGNHEFDIKEAELMARNDQSQFKIISANVLHNTAEGIVAFKQSGKDIPSHLVHSMRTAEGDTFRLGLTGVTLDFNKVKWVTYLDPYLSAEKAVKSLQDDEKADATVVISHLTMDMDDTLARRVPSVPLILGGHEHVHMTRKVGESTIYKADANAKTVYIHRCIFDPETKELRVEPMLFPITDAMPADPQVAAVVEGWESFAEECMKGQGYRPNDTIGFFLQPLDGREDAVRFGQTNLGALITDGIRGVDAGVQVVVMNSGSIRLDDMLEGFIRERDILATLPFGGGLQKASIKGKDLRRILDTGLSQGIKGNGAYLQVSGVAQLGSDYMIGGKPLEAEKSYVVAVPAFMAGGGENALSFIKDFGPFTDISLPKGMKNDIRDITIHHMRKVGNMDLARQLMMSKGR